MAVLTGCGTTTPRIEYIRAECELPPLPTAPAPAWEGGLLLPFEHIPSDHPDWARYDATLDTLEAYDEDFADAFIEHRAVLRAVCEGDG